MKEFVEKLIGRLEKFQEISKVKGIYGEYRAYSNAIGIVNQLAEEYNGYALCKTREFCDYQFLKDDGWIPVSDRLPEKSGKYIVTQKRYSLDDRFRKRPISIETDYVEFNKLDNSWCRAKFLEVIAWKKIEPYQPKGE